MGSFRHAERFLGPFQSEDSYSSAHEICIPPCFDFSPLPCLCSLLLKLSLDVRFICHVSYLSYHTLHLFFLLLYIMRCWLNYRSQTTTFVFSLLCSIIDMTALFGKLLLFHFQILFLILWKLPFFNSSLLLISKFIIFLKPSLNTNSTF